MDTRPRSPPSPTLSTYSRAISSRSLRGTPRSSRPKAALRSTLAHGISAKSWNTKARSGPGAATGVPFTSTRPDVAWTSPAMIFSVVVFPQPLGPMMLVSSPRGTSKLTPSRARTPPSYSFVMSLTRTAGRPPSWAVAVAGPEVMLSVMPASFRDGTGAARRAGAA